MVVLYGVVNWGARVCLSDFLAGVHVDDLAVVLWIPSRPTCDSQGGIISSTLEDS